MFELAIRSYTMTVTTCDGFGWLVDRLWVMGLAVRMLSTTPVYDLALTGPGMCPPACCCGEARLVAEAYRSMVCDHTSSGLHPDPTIWHPSMLPYRTRMHHAKFSSNTPTHPLPTLPSAPSH